MVIPLKNKTHLMSLIQCSFTNAENGNFLRTKALPTKRTALITSRKCIHHDGWAENLNCKEHVKKRWSKRTSSVFKISLLTTELVDLRDSVLWWYSCDRSCPYIFVGLSCRANTVKKFQVLITFKILELIPGHSKLICSRDFHRFPRLEEVV